MIAKKKNRPLPSGKLPIPLAVGAAVIFPMMTLVGALLFSQPLALILALYLVLQLAYSFWLKHVAIVDVLVVMTGFILRVIAGVVVIDVQNFSPWLYAVTGLLALFLAVGKRRQELITLGENAVNTRPIYEEYNLPLIDDMLRVVTTSTFITYMLYTIESQTKLGSDLMLTTVPFVLYGLFRYLYLIHVRGEGSAPDEVLLKDRPLQINILLFVMANIIIIYVLPKL
jgi:4-hydroxybenzoate polyprenyltransferase